MADGTWIPIARVLETEREATRADMAAGRLRYRYYTAEGFEPDRDRKFVHTDPGPAFWRLARVNWTWGAIFAEQVALYGVQIWLSEVPAATADKEKDTKHTRVMEILRARRGVLTEDMKPREVRRLIAADYKARYGEGLPSDRVIDRAYKAVLKK